jgi:GTP-binding protein HflX
MIDTEKDRRSTVERAILVGICEPGVELGTVREHLAELHELASTLDIPVVDQVIAVVKRPNPRYLIGSGKAEEIHALAETLSADCLIFDHDLSPSQQRNWEKLTKRCVIDRREVILDIFATRASTREAVIQVTLAQLEYSLPRLTRAWTHLSRQRGGAQGTRGEGEQQIEVDRRIIQQRIALLKKELIEVRKHRQVQRQRRERHTLAHAAIVGYTNAGKSSLLNALTGANALVENKLFATLDPTTRQLTLPNRQELLLTDTVGFVRKLPHNLVDAFKSTLEEAVLADFLIHVLDIASPYFEEHWLTTLQILDDLGARDKPIITVFNKADLAQDPVLRARLRALHPDALFISARTGEGLDELRARMMGHTRGSTVILHLRLPPTRHDLAAYIHRHGRVLASEYDDDGHLLLTASIPAAHQGKLADFATPPLPCASAKD